MRVSDLERATAFYSEALGATVLTDPFVIDGDLAQAMLAGPAGVSFRMRHVGFTAGVLELFEVHGTDLVEGRIPAGALNVLHLGVQVDDVLAAMARVAGAGGSVIVPPMSWGEATLCFVTDPDGTVIELADSSIHELLVHTRARGDDNPAL